MSETKELIERLKQQAKNASFCASTAPKDGFAYEGLTNLASLYEAAASLLASQAEEIERLKAEQPKWESADAVDEGEHLFVYVHDGVAKYGVGIKAWQDADDAKSHVVGNFPWAGMPTHAMKLPAPPSGQNFDDFLAPSRAQLRAKVYADMEAEIARLTRERDEALEAQRALSFDSDRECRSSARLAYQFARALEALKPFAALMTDWDGGSDDGSCGNETMPVLVKIGDLRRARSVLQSINEQMEP